MSPLSDSCREGGHGDTHVGSVFALPDLACSSQRRSVLWQSSLHSPKLVNREQRPVPELTPPPDFHSHQALSVTRQLKAQGAVQPRASRLPLVGQSRTYHIFPSPFTNHSSKSSLALSCVLSNAFTSFLPLCLGPQMVLWASN